MKQSLRTPSRSIPLPTVIVGMVLFLAATSCLYAQQAWTSRTVSTSQDTLSFPCIVFTPDHGFFILYNRSDQLHYWITQPDSGLIYYSVRRINSQAPNINTKLNLLNSDSNSSLHFMAALGETSSCLQYATTEGGGTNTSFSVMQNLEPEICDNSMDGGASGVDTSGRLHLILQHRDSLRYLYRLGDGTWSQMVTIPAPTRIIRSPSMTVTPSGELHITYIGHNLPEDERTIFYIRGIDQVFDPPLSLASRSGDRSDDAAPVVLDPNGMPHILFTDHSTNALPSLKILSKNESGWEEAETIVEGADYRFGDISLEVDRYGAMHVLAGYALDDGATLSDKEIGYTENADGFWSPFMPITANDIDDDVSNPGNGFTAIRDSLLMAVSVSDHSDIGWTSVLLSRTILDFSPELAISPDTVDLGRIFSNRIDTAITIRNLGKRLYEALNPDMIGEVKTSLVDLSFPFSQPVPPIPGGNSAELPFSLSFKQTGSFEIPLAITSNGQQKTLLVRGTIEAPAVAERRFRLDTTEVNVGEVGELICRVDPPFVEQEEVYDLTFHLDVEPDALFPRTVSPTHQARLLIWKYDQTGKITITLKGEGEAITGNELFRIDFEGLLTGKPRNQVELDVSSPSLQEVRTDPGSVVIHGCETGRIESFGKGGFAGQLAPNPATDGIEVSYIAPLNVPVSFQLFDSYGRLCTQQELAAGTGEVQKKKIELDAIPSGLYFIELHIGQRVVTGQLIRE